MRAPDCVAMTLKRIYRPPRVDGGNAQDRLARSVLGRQGHDAGDGPPRLLDDANDLGEGRTGPAEHDLESTRRLARAERADQEGDDVGLGDDADEPPSLGDRQRADLS